MPAVDTKMSALPAAAGLVGPEILSVVQGGVTSRTTVDQINQARAIGVVAQGADPTGSASSVAGFQAAINLTADGDISVIDVPSGTYAGDLSTLSIGTRVIIWRERGNVTYSIAAPPGQRMFGAVNGSNKTRAWCLGAWGFSEDDGHTTGTTADQPRVYVVRNAQHTGGVAGANPSALSVQSTIGANVKNYEAALTVRMDESSTGDATIGPNFVGAQIVGARHAAHTQVARTYGLNAVANDVTTRGAIDGINMGGLIALEADIRASGPDTEAVRHGVFVVPRGLGGSGDGADTIYSGVTVRLADTGSVTVDAAYRVDDIGAGGGNSYNIGLYALAQINNFLVDMRSTVASGIARFGSTINTGQIAELQHVGASSTGAERIYGDITTTIISNTNLAETGQVAIQAIVAGAMSVGMRVANGVTVGTPTGGMKGDGTINVQGDVYKNGTAYSNPDYVFEHAYTGRIERFAENDGASVYQGLLTLDEVEQITRATYKLPGMDDEPLGAFGRVDRLLQLVEELYLYLFQERRERVALQRRVDAAGIK